MTTVQDSYLVILGEREDVDTVANDIENLAKDRHQEVQIKNKMRVLGVLQISCKADFAEAVRKLPSVKTVEKERRVNILNPNDNSPT